MQQVYRVFAYLIAAGVAVQAAAIAYGVFGLIKWVERGGTLDQSVEPGPELGGYVGFLTHLTAGIFVIPLIALLFLIFSFFAKIPGGIKWALIVFGLTVLQVALGLFAHEFAGLGWLHGLNALILFAAAVMAGMRVRRAVADKAAQAEKAEPTETVPVS
jgi:heme A synthase